MLLSNNYLHLYRVSNEAAHKTNNIMFTNLEIYSIAFFSIICIVIPIICCIAEIRQEENKD